MVGFWEYKLALYTLLNGRYVFLGKMSSAQISRCQSSNLGRPQYIYPATLKGFVGRMFGVAICHTREKTPPCKTTEPTILIPRYFALYTVKWSSFRWSLPKYHLVASLHYQIYLR